MAQTYSRWLDSSCLRYANLQKEHAEEDNKKIQKSKIESWKKDSINVVYELPQGKWSELCLDPRYFAIVDGKTFTYSKEKKMKSE